MILKVSIKEQDWLNLFIQKMTQPSYSVLARELKGLILQNGELDFRGSGGRLGRAISKVEAKEDLKRVSSLLQG